MIHCDVMITRYTQQGATWADLYNPSHEEIREVMEEYGIEPGLMGDLTSPVPRSGAVSAHGVIKVTLDFPVVKLSEREQPQEIKFLIGKKVLVSVRYGDIAALDRFAKEFEVAATLQKTKKSPNGGHIFVGLMNALYAALAQKLDYMEARLTDIEEEMFDEHEKAMVVEISRVSQRLIMFRQTLMVHESVLAEVKPLFHELFSPVCADAITDLELTFHTLARDLATLTANIIELRETNNSLLFTKQNEIMQTLTVMASITFPLALLSSIFGMNTVLPLTGTPDDFWLIIGIMLIAAGLLFLLFRHKRWL